MKTFGMLCIYAFASVMFFSVIWASCTDGERCIDGMTEHSAMPCGGGRK